MDKYFIQKIILPDGTCYFKKLGRLTDGQYKFHCKNNSILYVFTDFELYKNLSLCNEDDCKKWKREKLCIKITL